MKDLDFSHQTAIGSIRLMGACSDSDGYQYTSSGGSSTPNTLSSSSLNAVCYSKDGSYYAFGGDNSLLYLHNGTSFNNTILQIFRDSASSIKTCRFSYDTNYLAVGNAAGSIFIYTTRCDNVFCRQGYYASGGSCLACSIPCATCSAAASTCTSCFEGYYLNGAVCSLCTAMANCRDCRNASYCVDCRSGFYL